MPGKPQKLITLTGDKELDKALREYTITTQKKYLRDGARTATKQIVLPDYRRRVPVRTGQTKKAVAKAAKVKAKKRSRSSLGSQVVVDDEKFFQALGAAGRDPLPRIGNREFFHLTILELGGAKHTGDRTLTKALYDNAKAIEAVFKGAIKNSLRAVKFKDKPKK